MKSAELLSLEHEVGTVEAGKRADLLVVDENPLLNTKSLYGTGAIRLNDDTRKPERVGGVRYTIKGGVVHDAKALLGEVADRVSEAKD
ncbi:MAG: amidohydrolase family protein [Myxococcota bacterium]|nr:amidohydrolase family protein [Myxococcota bacterium]